MTIRKFHQPAVFCRNLTDAAVHAKHQPPPGREKIRETVPGQFAPEDEIRPGADALVHHPLQDQSRRNHTNGPNNDRGPSLVRDMRLGGRRQERRGRRRAAPHSLRGRTGTGAGLGGLRWTQVLPLIHQHLTGDNLTVEIYPPR